MSPPTVLIFMKFNGIIWVRRAHYVKNNERNDDIYKIVKGMRTEPTPPEGGKSNKSQADA